MISRLPLVLVLAIVASVTRLAPPAMAQPAASQTRRLTGTVRDGAGAAVAGATVRTDPARAHTTTDASGVFAIDVLPGDVLLVEAEGFDPFLLVTEDETTAAVVLAPLGSDVDFTEVIEMVEEHPTEVAGAVRLSRDELATLPGAGGDLLATLDSLPGVTQASGGGGGGQGVIIRGSAPEDSRILLDGFDIPQLYHFLQRSIIPTRAVAALDYLPGGFDVRHGRASSGIVSITSRGGGPTVEGAGEVSVIDASVLGAGPLGRHGTAMVSFRRSYLDAYLPSLLPEDVGLVTTPRYYDGLVRVDWDLSERWRGGLTVIGSDDLTELVGNDEQSDEEFHFRADTRFIRAIASSYWRGHDGLTVDAAASVLAQDVEFSFDDQFIETTQLSIAGRAEVTKRLADLGGLTGVVMRAGGEIDPRRIGLAMNLEQGPDEGEPDTGMDGPTQTFDGTFWLTDLAAWTAIEGSLSPTLRLTTGLRVDAFTRNGTYPVQPRAELSYRPDDKTRIRLAAGRYTRAPENQDEVLNTSLDPESATQVTLGGERRLGEHGSLQLTLYDTERTDLITRDTMGTYRNQGRGRSLGAEVQGSYRSERWFGWLSYSLSRSTRRDTATDDERLFDYDQTHDLVLALTYKTRNRRWQLGGKLTYTSGQPDTPIFGSVYDSDLDQYYPDNGEVNSERLPAHHQLDLRVDRFWRFDDWTLSAFLDVSNVYLNAKVEQYQYNYDYSVREEVTGLPIVPSIGVRGEL